MNHSKPAPEASVSGSTIRPLNSTITMTGLQVIERLRATFGKHLPALIITGTANPSFLQQRAPDIPFAMKPVAAGKLRAFLSQALRHEQQPEQA